MVEVPGQTDFLNIQEQAKGRVDFGAIGLSERFAQLDVIGRAAHVIHGGVEHGVGECIARVALAGFGACGVSGACSGCGDIVSGEQANETTAHVGVAELLAHFPAVGQFQFGFNTEGVLFDTQTIVHIGVGECVVFGQGAIFHPVR